jgi:tetratricopeptide (TPR) repeat protein
MNKPAAEQSKQPARPAGGASGSTPGRPIVGYVREADALMGQNKLDEAAALLGKANKDYPDHGPVAFRRADLAYRTGKRDEAKTLLERAIKTQRKTCNARFFCAAAKLGQALGDQKWADRMIDAGLKLSPNHPELHYYRGQVLNRLERWGDAARHLEVAVNLSPNDMQAMIAFGYALERLGDLDRARAVIEYALNTDPKNFNAIINLGNIEHRGGDHERAIELYREAMGMRFRPFLFSNIGAAYRKMYRFEQAEQVYRKAQIIDPANAGGLYNHANLKKETAELDLACAYYRRAIVVVPKDASYHWNLALALLANGAFDAGWDEYEWRWEYSGFPSRRRNFKQPLWQGENFENQVLLVHAEQGMGDHLQFARFIPLIAARGGKVVLECHGPLLKLFEHYSDQVQIVERLHPPKHFDLQVPLLSVPRALGVKTLDDLPGEPFLAPPPDFKFDIPEARDGAFKIGIIWGGNPDFSGDGERSTKLDYFLRLLEIEDVQLFSLQKGAREPELADAPSEVVRLSDRISDFCDTASIMTQMDLVITTCTSTAHLAGALGVPFWVVLSHNPDWRWLTTREDSPWYPSARLFRQERPGDWDQLFDRVSQAVRQISRGSDRSEVATSGAATSGRAKTGKSKTGKSKTGKSETGNSKTGKSKPGKSKSGKSRTGK